MALMERINQGTPDDQGSWNEKGGRKVQHPVSLLDLYPTLVDLCGLPAEPHVPLGGPQLDEFSLRPFLEDPPTNLWKWIWVSQGGISNT